MKTAEMYTLITGATSGIGYELAKIFAANGHNLVLVARGHDDLARTAEELKSKGVAVHTIAKDLFISEAAFNLYDELKAKIY